MNSEVKGTMREKVFSPSRTVWRTQMAKGLYTPHRVSRITCIVNQLLVDSVLVFFNKMGLTVYDETGRAVREHVHARRLGLSGEVSKMESVNVRLFRFTVPRENANDVIKVIINIADLKTPGRGSIFSQELMEFSKDPPTFNNNVLDEYLKNVTDCQLLNKLSYVICVLSNPGSGDQLAKAAISLGVCVPVITFGTGNDIRDQLGLIRITIPAEKEIVHLVMPEQDAESIIKLLAEHCHLDRTGTGYIYQTPVSLGMIDTRMRIGRQQYAASMEQIIAAIDQLEAGTTWRKRLSADKENSKIGKSMMPQDNCEVSIISDDARIEVLRATCLEVGATGATTSNVVPHTGKNEASATMIRSAISVPADITDSVVDKLLDVSTIRFENIDRIQVLDSPAAYVRPI